MHPAVLPASLAFAASLILAIYVAARRDKSDLHWCIFAICVALMFWTSGSVLRFTVVTENGLRSAITLLCIGSFVTPPLWLVLATRYARLRLLDRVDMLASLMIPTALAFVALVTNDSHRLLIREVSFEAVENGGLAWAGPIFWAYAAYAYACVLVAVGLYVQAARRIARNDDWNRALLLVSASLAPVLASTAYLFQWVPITFDPTPTALVGTLALLTLAIFRYQMFEILPLARRDVIEHLHDGVVMASASGMILDFNPSAAKILDLDPAALRCRRLADVLAELAMGDENCVREELLAQLPQTTTPLVMELLTPDDRSIEARVACVRDSEGTVTGQFAVLRDRTEERHGEFVVRMNQRIESVGTLAAGIAHEVNNPLAFIRSNLSQIYRMGEFVEEVRESVEFGPDAKLAEELLDLRAIAEETLDGIARIERIVADMRELANAPQQRRDPVDLNQCVLDSIRLANLRQEPGIRVVTALAERLPPVEGTAERLVQALLNLVVNAKHALQASKGGLIRVETRCDAEQVCVLVSDDGPGIPEDIQERIFDPFFTTKDPGQGSGLGLAIALDILRDHGGVLELRSRAGEGACFSARLPLLTGDRTAVL